MRRAEGKLDTTPHRRQASIPGKKEPSTTMSNEDQAHPQTPLTTPQSQATEPDKQQLPATTPITDEYPLPDLSLLNEKETAYVLLRHEGMTHDNTCKALNITSQSGWNLAGRIRRKTGVKVRSLGIADSKYVKAAHRAVHNLVRGKTVGDVKSVKDSTVLAAANVILDRAEPVIRKSINVDLKLDCSPVDLDKYLMPSSPGPQDVVIECHNNETKEISS